MKTFRILFGELRQMLKESPYIETIDKLLTTPPVKENLDKQVPSDFFYRQVISILKCRPKTLSDFLITKIIKRSIEPYMVFSKKQEVNASWKPIPYPDTLTWIQGNDLNCLNLNSPHVCNVNDPLSCTSCIEGGHMCQHLTSEIEMVNQDGTSVTLGPNKDPKEGFCLPRSRITESINPFTTDILLSFNENGWGIRTQCKYPDILSSKTNTSNCSLYKSQACKGYPLAHYNDITKQFTNIEDFDSIDFDLLEEGACNINTTEGKRYYTSLLPSENRGIGVKDRLVREVSDKSHLFDIPDKYNRLFVTNQTEDQLKKFGFKNTSYKEFPLIKPCKKDPLQDEYSLNNTWDSTTQTCKCSLFDGFVGAYIHQRGSTGLYSDDTIYNSEPLGVNKKPILNGEPANACVKIFEKDMTDHMTLGFGFYFEPERIFRGAILLPNSKPKYDGYLIPDRFNAASTTWRHLVEFPLYNKYSAYTEWYNKGMLGWTWNSGHITFPDESSAYAYSSVSCKEQYNRFSDVTGKAGLTNRTFATPHCYYNFYGEKLYPYNPRAAIEGQYFTFIDYLAYPNERTERHFPEDKVPKVVYIPSDMK